MVRARSEYKRKEDGVKRDKFNRYLAYFDGRKELCDFKQGNLRCGTFIDRVENFPDDPCVKFPDRSVVMGPKNTWVQSFLYTTSSTYHTFKVPFLF